MAWTADSTRFITDILRGLHAPVTRANTLALRAWQQAEGGSARWNPFNTTQTAPGAGSYNSVGVRNYTSYAQGLAATLQTLRNGYYGGVLAALHAGSNPYSVAAAVGSSPWGTSGSLMASVLHGYGGAYTPVAGSAPARQPPGALQRAAAAPSGPSVAQRMASLQALSNVHPVQINLPALHLASPGESLARAFPTATLPSLGQPTISASPFKEQTDQGAGQLAALRRSLGG